MGKYSNGCSLNIEESAWKNYRPIAGLLEDLIGSIEPPFEVSLSVVATMGSAVSVEMARSGPFHAEIVVKMGESWDNGAPGEWKRVARAIAGYMFSTSSHHGVLHWMEYIDEAISDGTDTPYND